MGRSILDEIALKTSGISAALEAQRSLLEHSAVFEVQRRLNEMIEQSGIAATQHCLDAAVQKLAPSLSASVENELRLRNTILEGTALGAAQLSHLTALQTLGQVENTAIQSLRSLTDSVAGGILDTFKTLETERRALLDGVQEQLRRDLDFRHLFAEDTVARVAREATAGLHSMAALWGDQLAQVTRGVVDGYRALHIAQQGLVSEEFHRLTAGIGEAQLAAFPSVAAMADQLADALRMQLPASVLDATFAGELLGRLQRAEAISSEDEGEAFLNEFLAWLWEKFQQLPVKKIVLHVFFEVLSITVAQMVSNWDADQREQRLNESMSRVEQHLGEKILRSQEEVLRKLEELGQTSNSRKYYVVKEKVRLREKPTTQARKIKTLSPNVMVEEIEQQGQWLFVEFFDYVDRKLKRGWVYKRYLQLVQDDETSR